jgi:hypothetical protein
MTFDPRGVRQPHWLSCHADQTEDAMKRRRERSLVQFPITEAERRTLKHRAIDQGVTLGEIVRKALGFPVRMPGEKMEGAAMR